MIMERMDISRLRKNRAIYLKVGLVMSLSLVIWGLSYTHYEEFIEISTDCFILEEEEIAVIHTIEQAPKSLPPLAIQVTENILAEAQEMAEVSPPELVASSLDKIIKQSTNIPKMHFIVNKALPPPPPLPAEPQEVDLPFVIVEKMPLFGDCATAYLSKPERKECSDQALLSYIAQQVRYPTRARENDITGTAVIQFIIDETGKVTHAEIIRDVAGGCGKEALRVITNMPDWTPGQQRTRKVKVQMTLPVKFELK